MKCLNPRCNSHEIKYRFSWAREELFNATSGLIAELCEQCGASICEQIKGNQNIRCEVM